MNDMNKTQRNKVINKLVYKFAEKLGYEVDMTEIDVTFISPSGDNNDNIEYRRSSHLLAALNWASDITDGHVMDIEAYFEQLEYMSDDELVKLMA